MAKPEIARLALIPELPPLFSFDAVVLGDRLVQRVQKFRQRGFDAVPIGNQWPEHRVFNVPLGRLADAPAEGGHGGFFFVPRKRQPIHRRVRAVGPQRVLGLPGVGELQGLEQVPDPV